METAFLQQAARMEEIHSQNQDLAQRLFNLEKLWLAEEQFTAELQGQVEVLQVRWHLWGFCALLMTNVQDQVCKCTHSGDQEVSIEVLGGSWTDGCPETDQCP